MQKYPDRVPIICEKNTVRGNNCPDIDKNKYLVPRDLTLGQFLFVIRKRIQLPAQKALFLIIEGHIPPLSTLINSIYEKHKSNDGFLYITYAQENVFG